MILFMILFSFVSFDICFPMHVFSRTFFMALLVAFLVFVIMGWLVYLLLVPLCNVFVSSCVAWFDDFRTSLLTHGHGDP